MYNIQNEKTIAVLIDADNKYTLNQRICSFDNYEFEPLFLLHLLNRHDYFLSFNDGNGQTNLRKDDILDCDMICPPLNIQKEYFLCQN